MHTASNTTCLFLMRRFDFFTMKVYRKCRKQGMTATSALQSAKHVYRDRVAAKNAKLFG